MFKKKRNRNEFEKTSKHLLDQHSTSFELYSNEIGTGCVCTISLLERQNFTYPLVKSWKSLQKKKKEMFPYPFITHMYNKNVEYNFFSHMNRFIVSVNSYVIGIVIMMYDVNIDITKLHNDK